MAMEKDLPMRASSWSTEGWVEEGLRWCDNFQLIRQSYILEDYSYFLNERHQKMAALEKQVTDNLPRQKSTNRLPNVLLAHFSGIVKDTHGKERSIQIPISLQLKDLESEEKSNNLGDRATPSLFISGTKKTTFALFNITFSSYMPEEEKDLTNALYNRLLLIDQFENFTLSTLIKGDFKQRLKYLQDKEFSQPQYVTLFSNLKSTTGIFSATQSVSHKNQIESELESIKQTMNFIHRYLPQRSEDINKDLQAVADELTHLKKLQKDITDGNLAYKGVGDSEQHLLTYLNRHQEEIKSKIQSQIQPNETMELITLHIHSRLDVCDFCGPSLYIELNRPDGVLQDLRQGLKNYTKQQEDPKLLILVSSREELKVDAPKRSRRLYGPNEPLEFIDISAQPQFVYQKVIDLKGS